jgi:hypothetical protein
MSVSSGVQFDVQRLEDRALMGDDGHGFAIAHTGGIVLAPADGDDD